MFVLENLVVHKHEALKYYLPINFYLLILVFSFIQQQKPPMLSHSKTVHIIHLFTSFNMLKFHKTATDRRSVYETDHCIVHRRHHTREGLHGHELTYNIYSNFRIKLLFIKRNLIAFCFWAYLVSRLRQDLFLNWIGAGF